MIDELYLILSQQVADNLRPMSEGSKNRLEAVQILRGIAALLVVVVHAIDLYDLRPDLPRAWLQDLGHFNDFGASGVDMFFVLSGFVMACTIENPVQRSACAFIGNRFVRVVPYYWLVSVPFLFVCLTVGIVFEPAQYVTSIAMFPVTSPELFLTPALFVGWTLAFELAFYSVVALAITTVKSRDNRLRLALQLTITMALLGLVGKPQSDLASIWFNTIWFEFALGMAAYGIWQRWRAQAPIALSLSLLAAGLAGLGYSIAFGFPFRVIHWGILNEGAGSARTIMWALPSSAILVGLLWLSEGPKGAWLRGTRIWKFGKRLGDASYSLYLLHPFSIVLATTYLPTNRVDADVVIVTLVALNIVIALAAYRWIEQPMLNALRRNVQLTSQVSAPVAQRV